MLKRSLRDYRLIALFILGCIALTYPVISLFNRDATVFGIPLLYAYLYIVSLIQILLAALTVRRRKRGSEP